MLAQISIGRRNNAEVIGLNGKENAFAGLKLKKWTCVNGRGDEWH